MKTDLDQLEAPEVRVPFDTNEYPIYITQGFHGSYHEPLDTPIDLTYAIDFGLEPGTIVQAVRGGIVKVMWMTSDKYYEGYEPAIAQRAAKQANFIVLDHGDFCSCYSHLEKDSHRFKEGAEVLEGQPIARTGLSGWIGQVPHLHFHLQRCVNGGGKFIAHNQTIPFVLKGYDGPIEDEDIKAEDMMKLLVG